MTGRRNPRLTQEMMQELGIDLNSVENGIPLSQGFHRRLHTEAYYDYIQGILPLAQTREEAIALLARLRHELVDADREYQRSGQLPPWITGDVP